MASRSTMVGQVDCPQCKAICTLPDEGPDALSTINYVLNNIKLQNVLKNQQ